MIATFSNGPLLLGRGLWLNYGSSAAASAVKRQRGNIAFDQVRLTARYGTGPMFQMTLGNPASPGDVGVYDANGNLGDGGGPPAVWVTAPAHHNSTGIPGQAAYDSSGNFYYCYAPDAWAQIGPGGWSDSF